jgi:nucleotide-binding universal stress UspA family protein
MATLMATKLFSACENIINTSGKVPYKILEIERGGEGIGAAIVRASKRVEASLIAMGSHGGNRPSTRLGSHAEHVIKHACVPVMAFRIGEQSSSSSATTKTITNHQSHKKILIPYDGTTVSAAVLRIALPLARVLGAAITLLYEVPQNLHTQHLHHQQQEQHLPTIDEGSVHVDPAAAAAAVAEEKRRITVLAESFLSEAVNKADYKDINYQICDGLSANISDYSEGTYAIAAALTTFAEEKGYDLIVMGTHRVIDTTSSGSGGGSESESGAHLLSSVASQVLRLVSPAIPVITLNNNTNTTYMN